MKKKTILFLLVVILIVSAVILISLRKSGVDAGTAQCIGENSVLYVKTGCSACKYQKDMFGVNVKYLNMIDCAMEPENCIGILIVPTWIINGTQYRGTRSVDTLKELTGC